MSCIPSYLRFISVRKGAFFVACCIMGGMEREAQGHGPTAEKTAVKASPVVKVSSFSDAQVKAALEQVVQERREVFRRLKDR